MFPTEWTNEKTLHFINLYKSQHVLWDSKHRDYYNKLVKNQAWNEVAKAMYITAEECKRRMTSLLSSLRREKAKLRRKVTTGRDKESGWFFFKSLSFLIDKDKLRKSLKKEIPPDVETTEEDDLDDEVVFAGHDSGSRIERNDADSCEPRVYEPPQPPQKRKRLSEEITIEDSSMKTNDEFPQISNAMKELRRISEVIKEERNEFDIFGSFVAANLNKLPLIRALKLQEKINSLITSERINYATKLPNS